MAKRRILIVEDVEADMRWMARIAEMHGIVERAKTPESLKSALASKEFAIVILDLTLQGENGRSGTTGTEAIDLLFDLRRDRRTIVVTGNDDPAVATAAAGHGWQVVSKDSDRFEKELNDAILVVVSPEDGESGTYKIQGEAIQVLLREMADKLDGFQSSVSEKLDTMQEDVSTIKQTIYGKRDRMGKCLEPGCIEKCDALEKRTSTIEGLVATGKDVGLKIGMKIFLVTIGAVGTLFSGVIGWLLQKHMP
jgi:ActR/RegA family two-component response regulator